MLNHVERVQAFGHQRDGLCHFASCRVMPVAHNILKPPQTVDLSFHVSVWLSIHLAMQQCTYLAVVANIFYKVEYAYVWLRLYTNSHTHL